MQVSLELVKLIKEFEGFRAKTYRCPAGYRTIGYGHMLYNNDLRECIDEEEAEVLLHQDINHIEKSVKRNINTVLTQGQFDALVSFTYNLGAASLQRSTLRQKVNRAEHAEVPREFMRWVYVNGVKLAGLMRRRDAEVQMYIS